MARDQQSLYSLNRGVVDRRGLARADVKRLALAAEVQTNWMPREIGPMFLRPGFGYLGASYNNQFAREVRFEFATDDLAGIELTNSSMRIWEQDQLLTRPAVSTAITNGEFASDLTGWTSHDEAGATSSWVASNNMQFVGDGNNRAIREQTVTCTDTYTEHALRIHVSHGPVYLRVGSTSGGDEYVSETVLREGYHSISFTPAGNFYVRFFSSRVAAVNVGSVEIESSGVVVLPTPWTTSTLSQLRCDQSGDVVFVGCSGLQQRRIERRGTRPNARSWSVCLYQSDDGPFKLENTTSTTLSASAIIGNITLTASKALFKSTHVGALFSLTSSSQAVTASISAENVFTSSIRITGLAATRAFAIKITGTFTATVVLQQSFDNVTWSDVPTKSYSAAATDSYNDSVDNAIIYYRIGVKTGAYTSGTAVCTLTFPSGSIRGIVRVTGYTSATVASAEVLTDLGSTDATAIWEEGYWSNASGWPDSVVIHEGRMWWAGKNGVWGSISDAYDSFDETFLGDAGPINRTIGSGPVDTIEWLLSLKGLLMGSQGAEHCVRSSSLDEPITPTNFNIKTPGTQGSGDVAAVKIDQNGYFVGRSGCKLFELTFDVRNYDYIADNLMELAPEIGLPGIVRIDVQRNPDTRIHCVRSDGTVVVCVINRVEQVLAWIPVTTSGFVEDVVVYPAAAGQLDDQVYYWVRRTIGGSPVRYREKWAQELDCRGGTLNLQADSYVTFSGANITAPSVPHLSGQQVVVWADGRDVGTDDTTDPANWTQRYSIDATTGLLTPPLRDPAANVVVGLPYSAQFQSARMGLQPQGGSPLNQQKVGKHIGFILADTHRQGIRFGPSFDVLDNMPMIEDGTLVTQEVSADYDQNYIEFPGTWTTDLRICIVAQAPRPATVSAVTFDMEQNT